MRIIDTMLASITGIIGTLLGVALTWFFTKYDEKRANLLSANKVLLLIQKQNNEFINIKKHFPNNGDGAYLSTKRLLIGKSEWRLSKNDACNLLKINLRSEELIKIVFDLMFLDKRFNDLLLAIQDFNECKEKLERKIRGNNNNIESDEVSELDRTELEAFYNAIISHISSLDFDKLARKLVTFLKKDYPGEPFVINKE